MNPAGWGPSWSYTRAMARRPKPDESRPLDPLGGGGLRHNPFAALRPEGAAGRLPNPPREPAEADAPQTAAGPNGRLVVALERKGHGGKSVVRIAGFEGAPQAKEAARALGKALGRGARAAGADILVQGADLDGPIEWLQGQGLGRIVRGTP